MPTPDKHNSQQRQLFIEIQYIVGDFTKWPHTVQHWFLHGVEEGRGQRIRPLLSAFLWVNGLNPVVFYEWCSLFPEVFSKRAVDHFKWIFKSFDNGFQKYLYSYNVTLGHYQKLDGKYHKTSKR